MRLLAKRPRAAAASRANLRNTFRRSAPTGRRQSATTVGQRAARPRRAASPSGPRASALPLRKASATARSACSPMCATWIDRMSYRAVLYSPVFHFRLWTHGCFMAPPAVGVPKISLPRGVEVALCVKSGHIFAPTLYRPAIEPTICISMPYISISIYHISRHKG